MEPAILISRLLLRTRRMYVASIRLDCMECTESNLITRVSDHLSRETYAKHSAGEKAF